jgi:hypothetical protein
MRPRLIGKTEKLEHLVSNHYKLQEEKLGLFVLIFSYHFLNSCPEMQAYNVYQASTFSMTIFPRSEVFQLFTLNPHYFGRSRIEKHVTF